MSESHIWIRAHLDYPHKDWCLLWPFSRNTNGYGHVGRHILVHRLMCKHRNGPPPAGRPFAAHSCERGHDGCVNPWHLDWKNPSENQLDRYRDKLILPRNKLTPEQVDEIRALTGRARMVDVAAQFKISEPNVRLIQTGKTWRLDGKNRRMFSREEVHQIRTMPRPARLWAEEFGVSVFVIDRIRTGKTYRYFENEEA